MHTKHTLHNVIQVEVLKITKAKKMDENANYDENFDSDMEVFISYFENIARMNDYDIFEEYTSETYGGIDVSLNLGLTNSQTNSNPQVEFQPNEQPEQQPLEIPEVQNNSLLNQNGSHLNNHLNNLKSMQMNQNNSQLKNQNNSHSRQVKNHNIIVGK
ncbi:uncharacterized protein LOC130828589 [Amaranthus tricolor]|uniref:uncharacterized protein LOC130828589 n=1 Tax=Amaranthus tricolor TaxID=29722 RepID=UPI002589FB02|nr:uncharacterized protein LOC130828589 [Amaranthus tricolor]